jgi:hypothetical protein
MASYLSMDQLAYYALQAGGQIDATAPVDPLPPDATPDQITHYIESNYPQVAPFLANDEIRALLVRPDIDTMDSVEIDTLLRKTNYWQTHGPESRAFDSLIGTDPQAAGELVDAAKRNVADALSKAGVRVDDTQIGEIAKKAIRAGWINSGGQISDTTAFADFTTFALGQQRNLDGSLPTGQAAVTADTLRAIANAYYVPMTERDLADRALAISSGQSTEDAFRSEMAQHSKSLFQNAPDIQKAIDSGRTPTDYFAPIKSMIADTLELTPDQVDLMSPKFQEVLQVYDPQIKGNRPMTLGEVQKWSRGRPEFAGTRAYKAQKADLGGNLDRFFGAVA